MRWTYGTLVAGPVVIVGLGFWWPHWVIMMGVGLQVVCLWLTAALHLVERKLAGRLNGPNG